MLLSCLTSCQGRQARQVHDTVLGAVRVDYQLGVEEGGNGQEDLDDQEEKKYEDGIVESRRLSRVERGDVGLVHQKHKCAGSQYCAPLEKELVNCTGSFTVGELASRIQIELKNKEAIVCNVD